MDFNFLKALSEGNQKEITFIYCQCFPAVRNFVLNNKGSIENAEDIFQKALLQILVRYRSKPFIIKTSYEAYLFTVCKNLWRRELNKPQNGTIYGDNVGTISQETDIACAIVEQERQELFLEKLHLISDNCKKILNMFFAKIPYSDIMKAYNYNSETVVKQRVFKCKKQLTDLIKKDSRYNILGKI